MSPTERALWSRVNRRAALLQPDLARAILRSFRLIAAALSERKLAEMIATGALERLYANLLVEATGPGMFLPVQEAIRAAVVRETASWRRTLPPPARLATVGVAFDVLNPRVIEAIRTMETRVLTRLGEGVRSAVRKHVELGLQAGVGPRAIARGLRAVVPLGERQVEAVANFRGYLEAGRFRTALRRELRDARFDATLRRLAGEGGSLTQAQIDRMVGQYARRMVAFNAETNARTAALDAVKTAQRAAWQDAIDRGTIDDGNLMKRWVQIDRPTKRESHIPLHGETVPFDSPYSTGQMWAGEGDWNCGCSDLVFVATGPRALAAA